MGKSTDSFKSVDHFRNRDFFRFFFRPFLFWFFLFVLFLCILYFLNDIMLPFAAGLVLAYLLDPAVDRFESWGLSRIVSVLVILFIFAFIFILSLLLFVPLLIDQFFALAESFPDFVRNLSLKLRHSLPSEIVDSFFGGDFSNGTFSDTLSGLTAWTGGFLGDLGSSLLSGGIAFFNVLSLLVVTPVVAFYMLRDWDKIVLKLESWIPRHNLDVIRGIVIDIDGAVAGFIRGQSLVCLIVGIFYAISLSLIGLHYGLLIGLLTGLLGFIPYIGVLTGRIIGFGRWFCSILARFSHHWSCRECFHIGADCRGHFFITLACGWGVLDCIRSGLFFLSYPLDIYLVFWGYYSRFPLRPLLEFWFVLVFRAIFRVRFTKAIFSGLLCGGFHSLNNVEQLALPLPVYSSSGEEDFLVTSSNALAVKKLQDWPHWHHRVILLVGPPGGGKTHLGRIWCGRTGGLYVPCDSLDSDFLSDLDYSGCIFLDDAPGSDLDELCLFHLINLVRDGGGFLLVGSCFFANDWNIVLPDLGTRLRSCDVAELLLPDDILLRGVLVKLFSDRGILVEEGVISYLVRHMERSLGFARALVAEIDRYSLSSGSRVTRSFVSGILHRCLEFDFKF